MSDSTEITTVERKLQMLLPIAQPAQIIAAHDAMRELVRGALREGADGQGDYGIVPGTDKKALWKAGAEKIALGMGCYFGQPRIVEREVDHDRVNTYTKRKKQWYTDSAGERRYKWAEESGQSYGLYRYVIGVPVINRATGEVVGEGIGSASTMESKYVDRPRDCENTAIKMAHKRAVVGGTLIAFGLSGVFQNGEEADEEEEVAEAASDAAPAPAAAKPAAKKAPAAKAKGGFPTKCKKCDGTEFWDNRPKKESGEYKSNAPDFKCRKCNNGVWSSSKDAQQDDPGEAVAVGVYDDVDSDDLPF